MSTSLSPHYDRLLEILADGEWHDGWQSMAEAEKRITPGVAVRRIERSRAWAQQDRGSEPTPRQRQRSQDSIIAMGRHQLMRSTVLNQLAVGRLEVDTPNGRIPKRGKAFRLRNPFALTRSLTDIAEEFKVSNRTLRRLLDENPEIKVAKRGRVSFIDNLAVQQLTPLIKEHLESLPERRLAGLRGHRQV